MIVSRLILVNIDRLTIVQSRGFDEAQIQILKLFGYKPENILWDPRKGVNVLDWEFVHAGSGLLDFSILLRHAEEFPFDLSSLEAGYRAQGGTLPEGWESKALVTDLINLIQLLDEPSERPSLFQFLKKRIDFTMQTLAKF